MNKIFIITVFVLLFRITIVHAQVEAEIHRPSINAEQFGFALKSETALNKGQLSVNIPLMTLKGKGYDLPISLTFYNGDVTFSTEASPVGLGWALMAGGVITTTIRGANDDQGWPTEHFKHKDYITERYRTHERDGFDFLDDILHNPMPDEYTYSLPGHSGTIEVSYEDDTEKMTLYPDESYKIQTTGKGYCITADDGNKFYFEASETLTANENTISTSSFLTKIETSKGGTFIFNYEDEEYVDLSSEKGYSSTYEQYITKRITSISSEFGTVTFGAEIRGDRGGIGNRVIKPELRSKRINRIELKDEKGNFIKGYDLDNSQYFINQYPDSYEGWIDCRHKLSSITQYDATGNRLPPYTFTYSYKFGDSKRPDVVFDGDECTPRDSWSLCIGSQVYVDLNSNGYPVCSLIFGHKDFKGITIQTEKTNATADDYFCLNSISYPNGATDIFIYENHNYSKINGTTAAGSSTTQGKRLAKKIRRGSELNQITRYIYRLHDAKYDTTEVSSGVLTNPSIHCATYYTPEPDGSVWKYRASRITSDKAFNSFMGPPVSYTEVEEIVYIGTSDSLRTIYYFEPQIVSPPVNYICTIPRHSSTPSANLVKIENRIYGTISGYTNRESYLNDINMTYLTYPVGEFYNVATNVDQPLKEVFIGKDGKVRSIKQYLYTWNMDHKRYGYKIIYQDHYNNQMPSYPPIDYGIYWISKSEYITHKTRLNGSCITNYYYDDNGFRCDSVYEESHVVYDKGRTCYTHQYRSYGKNKEERVSNNYFPDNITGIMEDGSSSDMVAVRGLIEKNMIADPIKTVIKRNDEIISGECKGYQMVSNTNTLMPMLKSLYKLKTPTKKNSGTPTLSGDSIDYHTPLYKDGEVITYDSYYNPEHVKLHDTQDRYYVWGYDGRFPIAVIDNIDDATFANLKSQILQLEAYKKIDSEAECTKLRKTNADIRSNPNLPAFAHITTYTYDPYFGMTSETDDSNLGTIYTYDAFGRLAAKYDESYKKLEEYNYHYMLQ